MCSGKLEASQKKTCGRTFAGISFVEKDLQEEDHRKRLTGRVLMYYHFHGKIPQKRS
jgi:hypothetical protein